MSFPTLTCTQLTTWKSQYLDKPSFFSCHTTLFIGGVRFDIITWNNCKKYVSSLENYALLYQNQNTTYQPFVQEEKDRQVHNKSHTTLFSHHQCQGLMHHLHKTLRFLCSISHVGLGSQVTTVDLLCPRETQKSLNMRTSRTVCKTSLSGVPNKMYESLSQYFPPPSSECNRISFGLQKPIHYLCSRSMKTYYY